MASKKSKVVDKWKSKKWYSVVAPAMFDNKEIAEVVAVEDKQLRNRVLRSSLYDLGITGTGHGAMFTTLRFRVTDVKGNTAHTKLIGHAVSPSFIKTFARRGKSLIHYVVDEKTKDDEPVRMKVIAVTGSRVSANTKKNIRTAIEEETRAGITSVPYEELMGNVIYGRFTTKLYQRLKKITAMRRVEVRKTELIETFE